MVVAPCFLKNFARLGLSSVLGEGLMDHAQMMIRRLRIATANYTPSIGRNLFHTTLYVKPQNWEVTRQTGADSSPFGTFFCLNREIPALFPLSASLRVLR